MEQFQADVSGATNEFMQPLLHIGYHKTGTTWLQRCVFQSPRTCFRQIGGAQHLIAVNPFGFKPGSVRKRMEQEIRAAQAQNLVPVLSAERLSGEPLTGGYDSKTIADRLAAVFPDARVLIVIREQTSMFLSLYKQYIVRGGAASFRQFLAAPRDGYQLPRFLFDFLEYHRLIAYYQNLFGAVDVLVLPYELLRMNLQAFLEQIGEFVGVPATPSKSQPVRVSPSALALSLKRHANRYVVQDPINPAPPFAFRGANEALASICREVDAKVPTALRDRYERRWRQYAERVIGTRYAESNARTVKLTGTDLRAFGYVCA